MSDISIISIECNYMMDLYTRRLYKFKNANISIYNEIVSAFFKGDKNLEIQMMKIYDKIMKINNPFYKYWYSRNPLLMLKYILFISHFHNTFYKKFDIYEYFPEQFEVLNEMVSTSKITEDYYLRLVNCIYKCMKNFEKFEIYKYYQKRARFIYRKGSLFRIFKIIISFEKPRIPKQIHVEPPQQPREQ